MKMRSREFTVEVIENEIHISQPSDAEVGKENTIIISGEQVISFLKFVERAGEEIEV